MSDGEPGFAEKVVVTEREYKGSYRALVSSMRFRNPILAKLDRILTRQGPPSEDGRVAVIELHDNHVRAPPAYFERTSRLYDQPRAGPSSKLQSPTLSP
jgi:hypothetical protein